MTLKRYYTLVCDGCGTERVSPMCELPEKARSYAKRVGWARVVGQYTGDRTGQDLCPKCHNESKPPMTHPPAGAAVTEAS
jgi:hypothetical protein